MTLPPRSRAPDPSLETAEAQLEERLQEVCQSDRSHAEDARELFQLEETLLKAAEAAKEAALLRRRKDAESFFTAGSAPSPQNPSTDDEPGVRDFHDAQGSAWRAWFVTPGQGRPSQKTDQYLGAYRDGWLAFEMLAGGRRKRMPAPPSDWMRRDEGALAELLARAVEVAERRRLPRVGKLAAAEHPPG
ncbi:MAG: hypothetical protein NVS4B3_12100 [Gemmatimonadaceae bacterium]